MTMPYPPRPGQPTGPRPTLIDPANTGTRIGPGPAGGPTGPPGFAAGWTPPAGPPVMPPLAPHGSGRPPRLTWLVVAAAVVAIVAVTLALVFTLGGGGTGSVVGHAAPASDPRSVAQTFLRLETARYNDSGTSTPDPTRALYGSVSCRADLAQMKTGTSSTPPPLPAQPRYTFTIDSISPTTGGRQLLRITRTDTTSGEEGDGLFYLQRESGAWKVCGLFDNTQPPPDTADGPGGSDGSTGSGSTGGAPATGSAPGPVQSADDPTSFLHSFAAAVSGGLEGTAATSICVDAPSLDTAVLGWTTAHDTVAVQAVDASGAASASARIQVSGSGTAPATYGLVLHQQSSSWCIEDVHQM